MSCIQPSTLARMTCNRHLIGKDYRYTFCTSNVKKKFEIMMLKYKCVSNAKDGDIRRVVMSKMSQDKVSPMTKTALESIAGHLKGLSQKMDVKMKTSSNLTDVDNLVQDLSGAVRDLVNCNQELVNLLLGDAYTYKTIVESQSSQVPVASREQHMGGIVDQGYEAESMSGSTITNTVGPTSRSVDKKKGGSGAKSLFRVKAKSPPSSTKTPPPSVIKASLPANPPSSNISKKLFGSTTKKAPPPFSSSVVATVNKVTKNPSNENNRDSKEESFLRGLIAIENEINKIGNYEDEDDVEISEISNIDIEGLNL
jgi:hypothetical protein